MSKQEYLLEKHSLDDLVSAGYKGSVFVPVCDNIDDMPNGIVSVVMSWSKKKIRTSLQNKALYKYFSLLAEKMSDSGVDLKKFMDAKTVSVPVTSEIVKTIIWRPVMSAMIGVSSTAKLSTSEVSKVYDVVARHMSTHFNVDVAFPENLKKKYPEYFNDGGE